MSFEKMIFMIFIPAVVIVSIVGLSLKATIFKDQLNPNYIKMINNNKEKINSLEKIITLPPT